LVQDVGRSLAHRHVEDSTADFEKILDNVILITSRYLQVRLDQKVLLRLFQESIKLSVLLLKALVRIEEMKSFNNINKIRLTSQVLAHNKGILIFLVEFSDSSSISLAGVLGSSVLDIW